MTMIHGSRSDAAITPILPLDGRYDLYGPVHKGLRRAVVVVRTLWRPSPMIRAGAR